MGRSSRAKGSRAELEVARLCEQWWRRLEPDCVFRRTPASGGLRGVGGRHDAALFNMAGDLMTTAKRWPWTVEVKRRERFSVPNVLLGKPSPVWRWFEQCRRDAEAEGLQPMLWFRKSGDRWRVLLPTVDKLSEVRPQHLIRDRWSLFFAETLLRLPPEEFVIPA